MSSNFVYFSTKNIFPCIATTFQACYHASMIISENPNKNKYLHNWKQYSLVSAPTSRLHQVIAIALGRPPTILADAPYREHLEESAYHLLTEQPATNRQETHPRHEKWIILWRALQILIFMLLIMGITPPQSADDIILSRGWILILFLAYSAITAIIHYYTNWYSQLTKQARILNAAATIDDVAAYLRTPECHQFIQQEIKHATSPASEHLAAYLTWYERLTPEEQEKAMVALRPTP